VPIGKRLCVLAVFFLGLVLTVTTWAQFGTQVQYFPQLAAGAGSETSFSIHNPGTQSTHSGKRLLTEKPGCSFLL